ncbi:hypothetical protein [Kribbella sindirgiensis]|uniref:Uncharacterized protein n=1 Tax=Kribbella sindirgiensis TaxID=1124744 RepID=A0A4R0JFL9_9ACTN|nr:hypothetical protein [Kribbella sindirgiensis]TCC43328.1 hypothetical protein E0H50_02300 [Kribbella sindirgiensis]
MNTKAWLWPVNAVGMLVIAVAAILQPVTMLTWPCDDPMCDPHGYVAIFSVFPTAFVVIVALIALGLLNGRRRSGFGVAIGAAAACAGMLVLFGEVLIGAVRWPLGAVTLVVAGLAIEGLRSAPLPSPL